MDESAAHAASRTSKDIPAWLFALGIIGLFLAILLTRGVPTAHTSTNGVITWYAAYLGNLAAFVAIGSAIAGLGSILARRNGIAKSPLLRNALIASWVVAVFAAIGNVARPEAAPEAREVPNSSESRESRATVSQLVASDAVVEPVQSADRPSNEPTTFEPHTLPSTVPWGVIARRAPYLEGTEAQRAWIRDAFWDICLAPRIPPTDIPVARRRFLEQVSAVEASLPPAAPSMADGPMTVSEYLSRQRHEESLRVTPETVWQWCAS